MIPLFILLQKDNQDIIFNFQVSLLPIHCSISGKGFLSDFDQHTKMKNVSSECMDFNWIPSRIITLKLQISIFKSFKVIMRSPNFQCFLPGASIAAANIKILRWTFKKAKIRTRKNNSLSIFSLRQDIVGTSTCSEVENWKSFEDTKMILLWQGQGLEIKSQFLNFFSEKCQDSLALNCTEFVKTFWKTSFDWKQVKSFDTSWSCQTLLLDLYYCYWQLAM